ncbi:hypothetical protein BS50DRAFT_160575 [Corynespora cassiicola Philippines]|uniref:Uncharacterized protein n=1 Tax=Corynespora cassiicola Philippines TaxID=1448308 RepID=A0A2T2N6D2_CORCC|nr:hypothetical protein BS50DRAFT_160575 [Corynespora cassiicola Philippines]
MEEEKSNMGKTDMGKVLDHGDGKRNPCMPGGSSRETHTERAPRGNLRTEHTWSNHQPTIGPLDDAPAPQGPSTPREYVDAMDVYSMAQHSTAQHNMAQHSTVDNPPSQTHTTSPYPTLPYPHRIPTHLPSTELHLPTSLPSPSHITHRTLPSPFPYYDQPTNQSHPPFSEENGKR